MALKLKSELQEFRQSQGVYRDKCKELSALEIDYRKLQDKIVSKGRGQAKKGETNQQIIDELFNQIQEVQKSFD